MKVCKGVCLEEAFNKKKSSEVHDSACTDTLYFVSEEEAIQVVSDLARARLETRVLLSNLATGSKMDERRSSSLLLHCVEQLSLTQHSLAAALLSMINQEQPENDTQPHPAKLAAEKVWKEISSAIDTALSNIKRPDQKPIQSHVAALIEGQRAQAQLAMHAAAHAVGCAEEETAHVLRRAAEDQRHYASQLDATIHVLAADLAPTEAMAQATEALLRAAGTSYESNIVSMEEHEAQAQLLTQERELRSSVERQIEATQADKTKLETEVFSLQQEKENLTSEVLSLQEKLAATTTQLERLHGDVEANKRERAARASEFSALAIQVRTLQVKHASYVTMASEHQRVAAREVTELQQQLVGAHVRERALMNELGDVEHAMTTRLIPSKEKGVQNDVGAIHSLRKTMRPPFSEPPAFVTSPEWEEPPWDAPADDRELQLSLKALADHYAPYRATCSV